MTRTGTIRNERPEGAILIEEGERLDAPLEIIEGWAALARHSEDGELEIISLYLQGDIIGLGPDPAFCPVVALTRVVLAKASDGLAEDALLARQHERLIRQALRTAHKSAKARTADLFLEIFHRLQASGQTDGNGFALPLTQTMLASALGMSTVHMNRILMQLQHEGLIVRRGEQISLPDAQRLSQDANFRPLSGGAEYAPPGIQPAEATSLR